MVVGMSVSNSRALPQIDDKMESDQAVLDGAKTKTQLQQPTPQEIESPRPVRSVVAGIKVIPVIPLAQDDAIIDSIQFLEESKCDNTVTRKSQASSAIKSQPNIFQPNNNLRLNVSSTPVALVPPNATKPIDTSKTSRRKLFDLKNYNESQLYKPRNIELHTQSSQLVETQQQRSSKVIPASPKFSIDPGTLFPLTDEPNKVKPTTFRTNSSPIVATEAVEMVRTATPELIQSNNSTVTSTSNQAKQNRESTISVASNVITVAQSFVPLSNNAISVVVKPLPIAKTTAKNRISKVKPFQLKKSPTAGRKKIAESKPKPVKKETKPKRLKSYEMKLPYPTVKKYLYDTDTEDFELNAPALPQNTVISNGNIEINPNAKRKLAKKRSATSMPNTGETKNKKSKITEHSTMFDEILPDTSEFQVSGSNIKTYLYQISYLYHSFFTDLIEPIAIQSTQPPQTKDSDKLINTKLSCKLFLILEENLFLYMSHLYTRVFCSVNTNNL